MDYNIYYYYNSPLLIVEVTFKFIVFLNWANYTLTVICSGRGDDNLIQVLLVSRIFALKY